MHNMGHFLCEFVQVSPDPAFLRSWSDGNDRKSSKIERRRGSCLTAFLKLKTSGAGAIVVRRLKEPRKRRVNRRNGGSDKEKQNEDLFIEKICSVNSFRGPVPRSRLRPE